MATATDLDSATLLTAIVNDGHVAVPIVRLCEALDASPAEIRNAARDLVKRGVVAMWTECPPGPALVLTPETADRLGLVLLDDSDRWVSRDVKPPRIVAAKRRHECRESDLSADDGPGIFASMPDNRILEPHQAAAYNERMRLAYLRAEEAETEPQWSSYRANAMGEIKCKIPQRIVGTSAIWPVPFVAGERCPICRDIRGGFVCIVCNSSSVDVFIGKPPSQAQLDRQAGRLLKADSKGNVLSGGLGKARAAG